MSENRPGKRTFVGMISLAVLLGMMPAAPCASALGAEAPSIDKGVMMSVRDTTATLNLTVPPLGTKKLDVTVFYGTANAGPEEANWEYHRDLPVRNSGKEEIKRQVELDGLQPETKYYWTVRTTIGETTTWSPGGKFYTRQWTLPWYGVLPIVLALLTLPFVLGGYLARRWRMPEYGWKIGLITSTLAAGMVVMALGWPPRLGIDLSGGVVLVYEVDQSEKKPGETIDTDELVSAISRRINPGGQKELVIRPYGVEQIEIIIPRVSEGEAERIENKVSQAGTLEFRILANSHDHKSLISRAESESKRVAKIVDASGNELGRWVPVDEGREKEFPYDRIAKRTAIRGDREVTEILVKKDPYDVTGGYLDDASTSFDPKSGDPCVRFVFDSKGARKFARLTGSNLPEGNFTRKLGIILDGKLYSAPSIQSTISDEGIITGSFTQQEVKDLVDVLNAGSLPTALAEEPISRMSTGPTLGLDTIRKGAWAIGISMVLVLVFMIVYYRFAGVVACGALLANLVLILGIMIAVKAAFTLPGLAGLVLTVGMAVDANVLIFERIREEMARGAALRMAIRNGFARATTTIVDANLTTLITATVLYVIGTDQVKGFAITLWLGVLLSMYTAIFCSRVVFDIAEKRRWLKELKMRRILGKTQIDFLGKRRLAAAVSILVIVAGLAGVAGRREGLLDIDFTGGVSVEVLFDKPKAVADVRKQLHDLLPDLSVSDVQIEGEDRGKRFVINTSLSVSQQQRRAKSVDQTVKQQIKVVFGQEGLTQQRGAAVAKMQEQVAEAFQAERESETRREARAAIEKQINDLFADSTDVRKRIAAVEAVGQKVDEALRGVTAIDLVEEHLHDVFGNELAAMEVSGLETVGGPEGPPAAPTKPKPSKPAKPRKPDAGGQARNDLPPDSVLARADLPAGLLAQAEASDAEPAAPAPPEDNDSEDTPAPPTDEGASEDPPAQQPEAPAPPAEVPSAPPTEPPTEPPAAEPPTEPPAETESLASSVPGAKFAGGSQATLAFSQSVDHDTLRAMFERVLRDRDPMPLLSLENDEHYAGDDTPHGTWTVRIDLPAAEAQEVFDTVEANLEQVPLFPSSNTIGGKVAGDTRMLAITALVTSLLFIVAYIWIRFQRVVFGLAAVVALVHDVLVTLGVIALSAWLAGPLGFLLVDEFKIGLPVLAAFLTIIGYSLNDTIVVFDRIREVRGKAPRLTEAIVNTSINQTLSRTLLTSMTTLIVVLILYVGGGQGIHAFAFALVIGVIVGTYSSIFVASPVLLWMSRPPKTN